MTHHKNQKFIGATQRGFTLIELLIALTIGAFLVGGMLQLYVGSKKSFNVQSTLTELQEIGRFSLNSMIQDARMAGFLGCGRSDNVVNTLNGGPATWFLDAENALVGYEGGAGGFPPAIAGDVIAGTDAFTMIRAEPDDRYVVQTHSTPTATLTLTQPHDLQQGEVLMVTDCLNSSMFQMSNANPANTEVTIQHAQGVGVPGNCTSGLGAPLDCSSAAGTPYQFGEDSFVMRMTSRVYYIGTGASGRNALFRREMTNTGALGAAVELADGVADMQIVYGRDTDGDGGVDQYDLADAIAGPQWAEVLSIQINLSVESAEDNLVDTPQSFIAVDGQLGTVTNVAAADRRLRRVYSATTTVRNRAIL
ncbi:MAG: PilW family protein [Pseudomonadota bacterium]